MASTFPAEEHQSDAAAQQEIAPYSDPGILSLINFGVYGDPNPYLEATKMSSDLPAEHRGDRD